MPKLDNWACVSASDDPYKSPEASGLALKGQVVDHPRFDDGKLIRTSRVIKATGRTVVTISGSVYELGDPEPGYVAWLKEQGLTFNPDHPIVIRTGQPN